MNFGFFELPPEVLRVINFLAPYLKIIWQIIKNWWWLPLPFILWRPFLFVWLWWRIDKFLAKQRMVLLEIKIPKEVVKPIRAMEVVMDGLHQTLYQPPDWWEKWIDGQVQLSYSFEIVSIGGETHFFIRVPNKLRDSIESIIYGQYPEVEISLADDYTKKVPQDIPNKDWDLWGADYRLLKPDPYPIKTYRKFETEHEALEEKKVDPLAGLLEAMAKIKPGEQLWVQIIAEPVTSAESDWIKRGKQIRDELARRISKHPGFPPIIVEALNVLITGKTSQPEEKKEEILPPEMKLTPGEREIIAGIEEKISKSGFKTNIRFIYLGKRDVFFKPNLRLPFAFFAYYKTEHLNGLVPWGKTITKIHKSWFLPLNLLLNRRLYMRQRKLFRNYIRRVNPLFPHEGGTFILNTEELASLFHFPGRGVAPAPLIPRLETKKGEAPPGLPTE